MRMCKNDTILIFTYGKKSTDYFAIDLVQVIAEASNKSKSEVKRLIDQGGINFHFRDGSTLKKENNES